MVKRTASSQDQEPDVKESKLPSAKEHLFQCVNVYDIDNKPEGLPIDHPDIVYAQCEVVGGDEEGRSLLNRLSLDDNYKGFFATRLFLKAVGEPYKGADFPIDTENWVGRQFFAKVIHNGKYANIDEYNFENKIDQVTTPKKDEEELAWDEK